jgi:hypothetical protein
MQRLAAAGITTVLAVPSAGAIRNRARSSTMAAPDDPQIGNIGEYRGGLTVSNRPLRCTMSGQHRRRRLSELAPRLHRVRAAGVLRRAVAEGRARVRGSSQGRAAPALEPALDAIIPALERKVPVAFDGGSGAQILRALAMAKEFNLDVIISRRRGGSRD